MQTFTPLARRAIASCLLAALSSTAFAQVVVNGLADRTVYADSVTFTISLEAGYDGSAQLDAALLPFGEPVSVTAPDYHELAVQATNRQSGQVSSHQIQFIVRASARGNTEWGLPPWTPYPSIPSAPAELAQAQLEIILPPVFPSTLELPVVARLTRADGRPVRVNGTLLGPDNTTFALRRGIGSGFLPANQVIGTLDFQAQIQGVSGSRTVLIEPEPLWLPVSGMLPGVQEWSENARMTVTNSITVPADGTLIIRPGTIVRLDPGVDFVVEGRLTIAGSPERPVVFTPRRRTEPWGGFILHGTNARLEATDSLFIGSGANPDWFDENTGYDVHRKEQALFLVDEAEIALTNCFAFDHQGQFGHGQNGRVTLDGCLVQKFITGGEYNGGSVQVLRSALIEFPEDSGAFADADNDGIYFTTGAHQIQDTLIGWTKDDGIDHGSGGSGTLVVSNCWVESCFHEAFAWSGGGRVIHMADNVSINCGQGIEAGWSNGSNSPRVYANHCLSLGNLSGARFGDNYDWTYNGYLQVTNSFLLHNYRDIFGYTWNDWSYRGAQMDLHDNWLTTPDPRHPLNQLWNPLNDAHHLAPFMTTPTNAPVGVGLALHTSQLPLERLADGIPVGLSSFTAHPVIVSYTVDLPSQTITQATLQFLPGETLKRIPITLPPDTHAEIVRLQIAEAQGAEITGMTTAFYLGDTVAPQDITLVPTGSWWSYLDDGSNQGSTWTALDFDDSTWSTGQAELGYGDAATTPIGFGPDANHKYITTYFRHPFPVEDPGAYRGLTLRLKRDDGAVVHLNGQPVFVSNITDDPITYLTTANLAEDDGSLFFSQEIAAAYLHPGTNVLAVEIHQESGGSSDISFDLDLMAAPLPALQWLALGGETFLFWSTPAYRLETTEALASPWQTLSSTSPAAIDTSVQQRFYRLRAPPPPTP